MASQSASDFVDALYLHCLKRDADPDGRAHFEHLISDEGWSFEQVASAVMDSPEYRLNNALSSPVRQREIPRPRLCFIHIEKTAGTSLHDYLMEIYPPSDLFPERLHRLADYADEEFQHYRLYSGHYDYRLCYRMPADTRFITFLRRPQDRILSLYYFWRSVRSHPGTPQVEIAQQYGLADFLRHPGAMASIDDIQLSRILPTGAAPGELAAGSAAVDNFAFVGITELYSLSVVILSRQFGWPPPSRLFRRLDAEEIRNHPNHQPVDREPVTPEIEELLSERTMNERPVYDYAVRRLAAAFRESFGIDIPDAQLPRSDTLLSK